jgi:hypothetical protein
VLLRPSSPQSRNTATLTGETELARLRVDRPRSATRWSPAVRLMSSRRCAASSSNIQGWYTLHLQNCKWQFVVYLLL